MRGGAVISFPSYVPVWLFPIFFQMCLQSATRLNEDVGFISVSFGVDPEVRLGPNNDMPGVFADFAHQRNVFARWYPTGPISDGVLSPGPPNPDMHWGGHWTSEPLLDLQIWLKIYAEKAATEVAQLERTMESLIKRAP